MKYELRSISMRSVIISGIPVVLFLLGLFGGLMTFLVLPAPGIQDLTPMQRVMAAGLFSLLYMVLMVCLLVLVAFMYNFFTQTVGMRGLRVELEAAEDETEEPGSPEDEAV